MAERDKRGVELSAPLSANTLVWRGETFHADKRGVFMVPDEAVPELLRHGFAVGERKEKGGK